MFSCDQGVALEDLQVGRRLAPVQEAAVVDAPPDEVQAWTFSVMKSCHRELHTPKESLNAGCTAGANQSSVVAGRLEVSRMSATSTQVSWRGTRPTLARRDPLDPGARVLLPLVEADRRAEGEVVPVAAALMPFCA